MPSRFFTSPLLGESVQRDIRDLGGRTGRNLKPLCQLATPPGEADSLGVRGGPGDHHKLHGKGPEWPTDSPGQEY